MEIVCTSIVFCSGNLFFCNYCLYEIIEKRQKHNKLSYFRQNWRIVYAETMIQYLDEQTKKLGDIDVKEN